VLRAALSPSVLALVALGVLWYRRRPGAAPFGPPPPLGLAAPLALAATAACWFASYYATGGAPPGRARAVAFAVLALLAAALLVPGAAAARWSWFDRAAGHRAAAPLAAAALAIGLLAHGNVPRAWADLAGGTAAAQAAAVDRRDARLAAARAAGERVVTLPPLGPRARLLPRDPEDGELGRTARHQLARWFGLERIELAPPVR
jgi:hypothetical protein